MRGGEGFFEVCVVYGVRRFLLGSPPGEAKERGRAVSSIQSDPPQQVHVQSQKEAGAEGRIMHQQGPGTGFPSGSRTKQGRRESASELHAVHEHADLNEYLELGTSLYQHETPLPVEL